MMIDAKRAKSAAAVAVMCLLTGCPDAWSKVAGRDPLAGRGGNSGKESEATDAGSAGDPTRLELTLVPTTAMDAWDPIAEVLEVVALDSVTGQPLEPGVSTFSEEGTGRVVLEGIAESVVPSLYVVGNGSGDSDLHDTVQLNIDLELEGRLLHAGSNGLDYIAEHTANYEARPDRAPLSGRVYWHRKDGPREGPVGCATLFLDDNPTEIDADTVQCYVESNGLPTTPDLLRQTRLGQGGFYFGNLPMGPHMLRVSVDGGESFLGAEEFIVNRARQDTLSPAPRILYLLSIDLEAESDPTPADCPEYEEE